MGIKWHPWDSRQGGKTTDIPGLPSSKLVHINNRCPSHLISLSPPHPLSSAPTPKNPPPPYKPTPSLHKHIQHSSYFVNVFYSSLRCTALKPSKADSNLQTVEVVQLNWERQRQKCKGADIIERLQSHSHRPKRWLLTVTALFSFFFLSFFFLSFFFFFFFLFSFFLFFFLFFLF